LLALVKSASGRENDLFGGRMLTAKAADDLIHR